MARERLSQLQKWTLLAIYKTIDSQTARGSYWKGRIYRDYYEICGRYDNLPKEKRKERTLLMSRAKPAVCNSLKGLCEKRLVKKFDEDCLCLTAKGKAKVEELIKKIIAP